jgi:hypothetical protein
LRTFAVLLLLLAAARAQSPGTASFETIATDAPELDVADWKLLDLNGNGRTDILLLGGRGELRTWLFDSKTSRMETKPRGDLVLPEPARTLLAWEKVLEEGDAPQIVALSPQGAMAYLPDGNGVFGAKKKMLASRARFKLRVNDPLFAGVVQDINRDGKLDIVVPGADFTEVFIRSGDSFLRTARIAVEIDRWDATEDGALSNTLSSTFRIPNLRTQDVNGDGRPDLLVKSGRIRSFHIQREDGSFPADPDVTLNLAIFKDTTPSASLRPGRTLAGGDSQRYESRDLDGDGIPDYVIAHRRKVWVFHGNKDKPQFTQPTTILKVSDDITALLITKLNDDDYPDLLLLKVQVPSAAGLVAGLVGGLDIDASALGYANEGGRSFGRTPEWRSTITLQIPSLTKVLKDPGSFLEKFDEAGRKFRVRQFANLNGDKFDDTLLLSEDKRRIDYWPGVRAQDDSAELVDFEKTIRRILFEDENKTWDLDRILEFISGLAERRTNELTGGRAAAASIELRDPKRFDFMDFATGDLDGDGRDELVIRYAPGGRTHRPIFDVIRLK